MSSKEVFNKTVDTADDIWDDTLLIRMYEESIRSTSSTKQTSKSKWKQGDKCTAPYSDDGLYYRAVITRIAFVKYEGYEEDEAEIDVDDLAIYVEGEDEESFVENGELQSTSKITSTESYGTGMTEHSQNILPPFAPPPPPIFSHIGKPDEVEALSSMLMSWYMSGYHTGCYVTMQQMKKEDEKKNNQ